MECTHQNVQLRELGQVTRSDEATTGFLGSLQTTRVCIPPRPAEYDLSDSFTGASVTRSAGGTTGFLS